MPELDAAGLPEELSAFDQILHRGEAHPRTRSGIMTVELLDTTPDWERFRERFDIASRKVLRFRQKVVMPTLPTVAPRWVVDPDFSLDFHVRRVRVPAPGTLREVFDLAEVSAQSPLDISRPLWTATLLEGLEGGCAALMVHLSHAVTDGVGGVEMFANLYDLERDPPPQSPPPLPIPQDLSPNDLMRQGFNRLPGTIAGRVRGVLFGAKHVVGEMVRDPISRLGDVVEYAMSGARVVGPVAPPSPVLTLMPDSMLESMAGSLVNSDVQASNVPVYAGDTFIAGAKVLRQYGIGPLPGVAMMVVLISRAGYCTITTRYDRASVADSDLWARCLLAGFDEVLALGGDGRASPASFRRDALEPTPVSPNGSAAQ